MGDGFPGSLAVSILRSNLSNLTDGYEILVKTDGIRYWMIFMALDDGEGGHNLLVDMVDRSFSHIVIQSQFPKELYRGV